MLRRAMIGVAAMVCCLFGQTPATPPAFEVAAIQPTPPPPEGGVAPGRFRQNPGGIDYYSVTIYSLILKAYGIPDYQLSAPPGIGAGRWNIVAHAPANTTPEQIPLMLQSLLADRFKLQVHRESKEISAYALVVARGGSKLKAVDLPEGAFTGARSPSGGMRLFGRVSLAFLAQALSPTVQRPIVDMTGLPGIYDVSFEYMRDEPGGDTASLPGMSVSDAIEKALSLKLEPRKIQFEMLIVDHVEKTPTAN